MPGIAVIGMQWGDEGKGKVIDLLADRASHILRAQGGNNAGHTIVAHGIEYRFHLIPSGIIYPHTRCYIGGGTVIDPVSLLSEIDHLLKQGILLENRLFLSRYAHVVMPYHRLFDQWSEAAKGKSAVGTTGRGIGPCYVDKASRCGIRIADLCNPIGLRSVLETALAQKNEEIRKLYAQAPLEFAPIYEAYAEYGEKLLPYAAPVERLIQEALKKQEVVLLEGAQGALLDTTFGTYPYVTSSCTLAGGLSSGSGVGPSQIKRVVGVAKAYTTRVGNGPMPTELSEKELAFFPEHSQARELGTTTGRKRRIGWVDTFLLRHTAALNGADVLAITKLDILDGLDEIRICTGYEGCEDFPVTDDALRSAKPVYEIHPGWKCSTRQVKEFRELPLQARRYLERLEELCQVPVGLVSIGPEREKTIWMDWFTP